MTPTATRPLVRPRLVDALFDDIRARHPRSLTGVLERGPRPPNGTPTWPTRSWAGPSGPGAATHSPGMVDAFVRFTTSVNMAQARYERAGRYENKTFQDCLERLYTEAESMDDYLLGVYLTNFLWAHHAEICFRFEDQFLKRAGMSGQWSKSPPATADGVLWRRAPARRPAHRVRHQPVVDPARVRADCARPASPTGPLTTSAMPSTSTRSRPSRPTRSSATSWSSTWGPPGETVRCRPPPAQAGGSGLRDRGRSRRPRWTTFTSSGTSPNSSRWPRPPGCG